MATRGDHLAQAVHNESVAERLAAEGDFDWAVTSLFYSALHLVQAYFAQLGENPKSHASRERRMRELTTLQAYGDAYRALRSLSENARYDCHRFTQAEFDSYWTVYFEPIKLALSDQGPGG